MAADELALRLQALQQANSLEEIAIANMEGKLFELF
jgi:hypothetical protein